MVGTIYGQSTYSDTLQLVCLVLRHGHRKALQTLLLPRWGWVQRQSRLAWQLPWCRGNLVVRMSQDKHEP